MKKMEEALQRKIHSSNLKLEKKRKWTEESMGQDHEAPRIEVQIRLFNLIKY